MTDIGEATAAADLAGDGGSSVLTAAAGRPGTEPMTPLHEARIGPGDAVQVIWGTATDRGRIRKINEDALLVAPPVFVVSDGMGGHAAGDVAAQTVVSEFNGAVHLDPRSLDAEWVVGCITRAGERIRSGAGGGATVVGLVATEYEGAAYWLAFNIGDSRVYRSYDGELAQVSVDHSYVQELVEAGQLDRNDMRRHPQRNVITRAVGLVGEGNPDCWLIPAREGERLLLCSDGITGELSDGAVGAILASHIDPQHAANALIAAAIAAGGRDNATAIVIDVLVVAGVVADRPTLRHGFDDTDKDADDDMEHTLPGRGRP